MEGLSETVLEATERFNTLESKRELALAKSRSIIRLTKNMIHAIHLGEDYSDIKSKLSKEVDALFSEVSDEPRVLNSSVVEDAMMEYSEACLFAAVCEKKPLPSFTDLKISPQSWAMGLADCVGELRRKVLTYLSEGRIDDAKYYYSCMEEISDQVMSFDVPDAIIPIRRKQDVTRALMERTLSDVTNAILMDDFKKKL